MKVFRKMFALAVSVAAIAMATSAFAATAEYDATNVLVKVADTSVLNNEAGQATVAVVPTNFGENGTDAQIYFIDQNTADVIAENLEAGLKIKDAITVPTDYQVRVAGTNTAMQTINFSSIQVISDVTKVAGSNATAVGFTGTFQYNGGTKAVVLKFTDSNNAAAGEVSQVWDLTDVLPNNVAAGIIFGLEIQADNNQNLEGISVSFANAQ